MLVVDKCILFIIKLYIIKLCIQSNLTKLIVIKESVKLYHNFKIIKNYSNYFHKN